MPSSPLLAEAEATLQQPVLPLQFPIGHDSAVNYGATIFTMREVEKLSIFQVGLSEVNVVNPSLEHFSSHQSGTSQVGISQVSFGQISRFQDSSFEDSTFEISVTQISPIQPTAPQSDTDHISHRQIGVSQVASPQVGSNQVSLAQIDPRKLSINQLNFPQISPAKISLTSSITLQQLLSSHNFNLLNTTNPAWTAFLQEQAPSNLNFESRISQPDNLPKPTSQAMAPLVVLTRAPSLSTLMTTAYSMMRFKSFNSAKRTLSGIETINRIRRGQVNGVNRGDRISQAKFINAIFKIIA